MGKHRRSPDSRGGSFTRRQRRAWMIETFGIPRRSDGEKTRIACYHCGKKMRAARGPLGSTWHVDRFPVCGHLGGGYARGNIVPACKRCNESRCRDERVCERIARRATGTEDVPF